MNRLLPLLLLAGCTAAAPTPDPNPGHAIKVLSVSCAPNYGRPRAEVAVQNIGSSTLEFPKVMVSFGGAMHDSHLSPRPLRPGGTATATLYAEMGQSSDCSLVNVQDRDGFAASIAR